MRVFGHRDYTLTCRSIASICRLACRHSGGSSGRTVACAALRNDPRWSSVEDSKQIHRRGPCQRGCVELVRTPSIAPICQPRLNLLLHNVLVSDQIELRFALNRFSGLFRYNFAKIYPLDVNTGSRTTRLAILYNLR